MKAISLTQPWATACLLIVPGHQLNVPVERWGRALKEIETRNWSTNHRGRTYIHAAKGFPGYAQDFAATEVALQRIPRDLPFGAIIGSVDLVDVQRTEDIVAQRAHAHDFAIERQYGDYSPGRFGFPFRSPVPLRQPVHCRGHLGIWEVPQDVADLVRESEGPRS